MKILGLAEERGRNTRRWGREKVVVPVWAEKQEKRFLTNAGAG